MRRSNVILFETLRPSTVFVSGVFCALGIRVYYIKLADELQNAQTQTALYRKGVRQVDFSKLSGFGPYDPHKIHARLSRDLLDALYPAGTFERVGRFFPQVKDRACKLRAVFYEQIASHLDADATLIAVGEHMQRHGANVWVWKASNISSSRLFRVHTPLKTIVPISITELTGRLVGLISRFKKTCRRINRGTATPEHIVCDHDAKSLPQQTVKPPMDADVLFFPHMGPNYGTLIAKDQYYSEVSDSAFAKERICHVELEDYIPSEFMPTINSAYQNIGVSPYFLKKSAHQLSKMEMLRTLRQCMRDGLGLWAALIVIRVRQRIMAGVSSLSVFPKARLAVLGYEYLFPRWVAYTLQARGIQIAATQERLMQCFLPPWPLILDIYFVHASKVRDALHGNDLACVNEIVVSGDVRAELLAPVQEQKRVLLEGCDHLTLVLDWHSDPDPFSDRIHTTNSWTNNRDFYEAVLRLAQSFPKSCFVIRGKNDNWLKVEALSGIRDKLQSQHNVIINQDYHRANISNDLAVSADSIVARYTSLGDQALAAGKPVIYADWLVNGSGCIETICDFAPYPIIAHSCQELISMYAKVLETGRVMDENLQEKMSREYANKGPNALRPKDIVQRRLNKVLHPSRDTQAV